MLQQRCRFVIHIIQWIWVFADPLKRVRFVMPAMFSFNSASSLSASFDLWSVTLNPCPWWSVTLCIGPWCIWYSPLTHQFPPPRPIPSQWRGGGGVLTILPYTRWGTVWFLIISSCNQGPGLVTAGRWEGEGGGGGGPALQGFPLRSPSLPLTSQSGAIFIMSPTDNGRFCKATRTLQQHYSTQICHT